MLGIGGLFIFFNWAEVQKWFGGGIVSTGNCTINGSDYCWNSSYTKCVNGKTVKVPDKACITCTSSDRNACCNSVRGIFLENHPNKPCAGPGPGPSPGPTCKPTQPATGCSYDCKGNFCWRNYAMTNAGRRFFVECGKHVGASINTGCGEIRNIFCNKHSPDHRCGSAGCPKGTALTGNGTCTTIGVSNCDTPARTWIARNANAILGRMASPPTNVPNISYIQNNWTSIVNQLSVLNACSTARLRASQPLFAKNFALLLQSISSAFRLPLITPAKQAILTQATSGKWMMGPWSGGVGTFYGSAEPSPDTPYGFAYSPTLEGRENRYDPYGDQRYSFTLPGSMRVKVSN